MQINAIKSVISPGFSYLWGFRDCFFFLIIKPIFVHCLQNKPSGCFKLKTLPLELTCFITLPQPLFTWGPSKFVKMSFSAQKTGK